MPNDMKIIKKANMQELQFTCAKCGTIFIADDDDVREGMIPISKEEHHISNGYDYGECTTYAYRNYVRCPFCSKEIAVDQAKLITQ